MRYLGIDYGTKRVGIAASDEGGVLAFAKIVLPNDGKLLEKISEICATEKVSEIVLGESKNYKGEPNAVMAQISEFKKELEEKIKLPVRFELEFMTSAEAGHMNKSASANRRSGNKTRQPKAKNEMLDASAAAIILQSYLDRIKNS